MMNSQRPENFTKAFSSEKFIKTNNIFAIRGKKLFLFHWVCVDMNPNPENFPFGFSVVHNSTLGKILGIQLTLNMA